MSDRNRIIKIEPQFAEIFYRLCVGRMRHNYKKGAEKMVFSIILGAGMRFDFMASIADSS